MYFNIDLNFSKFNKKSVFVLVSEKYIHMKSIFAFLTEIVVSLSVRTELMWMEISKVRHKSTSVLFFGLQNDKYFCRVFFIFFSVLKNSLINIRFIFLLILRKWLNSSSVFSKRNFGILFYFCLINCVKLSIHLFSSDYILLRHRLTEYHKCKPTNIARKFECRV